jgi:pimeloyl-ACP methyl ester carboxylesterase
MTYVEVAGKRIWHEVVGDGSPVALLHGAFGGAASFFAQTPALVDAGYRVYLPERPGHAHSPDIAGPFTYSSMAGDTIAYLENIVQQRADLVGWSDGAVVALLIARDRPDLIRRIVLIGQYYNSAGKAPNSTLEHWLHTPEGMAVLRQGYTPFSPDGPEHFRVVFEKTLRMIEAEPEIELATLRGIRAPALILQGDRDAVDLRHSRDVVGALANARLAVLPGTHALPIELPGVVNPLLTWFLQHDITADASSGR